MIGALEGIIFKKNNINSLILMVQGVGYRVFVNGKLLQKVQMGEKCLLYIHTHVREDSFDLFGFAQEQELMLFEMLISVSGVGPKTALLVLEHNTDEIQRAIIGSDVSFFTGIPRLGTKNAQKIIIELKSKLGERSLLDFSGETGQDEFASALTSLGFDRKEIQKVWSAVSDIEKLEEKIAKALRMMGKKIS